MKTFRVLALTAALVTTGPGCSALFSNLPTVIAYVQEAQLVVSAIESFANAVFNAGILKEKQKDITVAIARTKAALSGVARVSSGAEKLNQADVDAAFVEFRLAYTDLVNLMKPIPGFSVEGQRLYASGPTAGMPDEPPAGRLKVPQPLLLKGAP